jgi:fluoride exporter
MKITSLLLVFVGGGLGSLLRYIIGIALKPINSQIPYATLLANVIGCTLLGVFMGFIASKSTVPGAQHLFFAVGFCGGLTTFSTFTLENMRFLEQGNLLAFLFYAVGSFALGLCFLYLGMLLHRFL